MLLEGRICYDISPLITERTAVFPGDVAYERKISVDFAGDAHYLASSIHTTVHLGAHTDAPNHYKKGAASIAERDLSLYYGDCQVITVKLPRGERIRPEHLRGRGITAARVLFNTGSYPDPDRWNGDFCSLSPELVTLLADQGVRLVGIDTPSVDPADDKRLESHQIVSERDLAVLEGIVLKDVPDGVYTLIALPLRLAGADASPVRAVLLGERK